jgi:pilus assembly protein CpaC
MSTCHSSGKYFTAIVIYFLATTSGFAEVPARNGSNAQPVEKMTLFTGKSTVILTPLPIKRVSVANPEIADTIVLSPTQLYVTGKTAGVTNLTLWQDNGHIMAVYDLDVSPDVSRLKEQLSRLLPDDKEVLVQASNDHLTLSGSVSSEAAKIQVLALAEAFAPKKIINLLHITGALPAARQPPEDLKIELIKGTTVSNVKFPSPER